MKFRAYIINLKHAVQRREHMRSQMDALQIPYVFVEGVYGDRLQDPIREYNRSKHHILTGKKTNKREIGCYLSHIKALKTFLESDLPYALILEDDATIPANIVEILQKAVQYANTWDLLRLSSSRNGQYLPIANLFLEYHLAYNIKVLKSAAAYFINRKAAALCVEKMLPMSLPFDVALDREWVFGFCTACIVPFPVAYEAGMESQIPIADRIHFYRATTFHLFHWLTHIQRRLYRVRCYRQAIHKAKKVK